MVELRRCQLFLACVCFCPLSILYLFELAKSMFSYGGLMKEVG